MRILQFSLALMAATLCAVVNASEHQAWVLDGAEERIEQYRKATAELRFRLPNGELLQGPFTVDFKLQKHAFMFGISMGQSWALHDQAGFSAYRRLMQEVFNTVSLSFFWGKLERQRNLPQPIDYLNDDLHWALSNGMTIKGTHLLWHHSLPRWFEQLKSPEEFERSLLAHIRYLLKSYPQVTFWNAYNEVLGAVSRQAPQNRVAEWVKWKGGPIAAQAFVLDEARKVSPSVRYLNNHYAYRDPAFESLSRNLLNQGVPPDGIGIQTHMHTKKQVLSEMQLWQFLEQYAQMGVPIQLTEVSVLSSPLFENHLALSQHVQRLRAGGKARWMQNAIPSSPDLEAKQAAYLRDFYTLAFSHPAVEGITYWSGSDLFEWRGSAAGLIDQQNKPKPAYFALRDLIRDQWQTRVHQLIRHGPTLAFRGFYGRYRGQLSVGQSAFPLDFCLQPGQARSLTISLSHRPTTQVC